MWEVEQLILALVEHSQLSLAQEVLEANRVNEWAGPSEMLGVDMSAPPEVVYHSAS